jgi:CBS domain containing-hemolysin-like protein
VKGLNAGDVYALAAAFLCLLGAAFFSAAQTALSRMSLVKAMKLADAGRSGAPRLVGLMRAPVRTLNILALLVLVLQVSGAALLTLVVARYADGAVAVVGSTLVAAGVLFVAAEVAPRTLALQRTDTVALATARWVRLFALPLAPLASVLVRLGDLIAPGKRLPSGPFVTAEELREMIDVAESDEVIEATERAMLHRVFKLGDTVVREIMVPRPDMVIVSADDELHDVVDVILRAGHSRVPVYADDRDRIVGVIYAKDALRRLHTRGTAAGAWGDLLREPHFVPELATVDQLLADMQAEKVHLAVVVDEYGGTAGLVTIEDVLEEIVGEIVDEYDREEVLVEQLGEDAWRIDARLPVDRLNELLGTSLPDEEWDSLGGLFFGVLGRVPAPGEQLEVPPVRLTAERLKGRRIVRVLVERLTHAEGHHAVRGSA